MWLYAEGFSLSHYLVHISDRPTFLRFVQVGMQRDWDTAVQTCYGLKNVEDLEESWLKFLRDSKGMTLVQLAQNKEKGQATATTTSSSGTVVRLTAPPLDPLVPVPVVRGAMPDGPPPLPQNRPGYLPEAVPSRNGPQPASTGWQVPAPSQSAPIPVQLGMPNYPPPTQPQPQWVSPVGYPQ